MTLVNATIDCASGTFRVQGLRGELVAEWVKDLFQIYGAAPGAYFKVVEYQAWGSDAR